MSFAKYVERRFPRCSQEQKEKLIEFQSLVQSFSKRMNLTAARDDKSFDEILLSDADVLLRCVADTPLCKYTPLRCVDVGAGAGAPAIPFAILRPDTTFTLVEPLRKRVTFLRTAIGSLGLASRIVVAEQKLDWEHPSVSGMPFDLAISRATVAPDLWLRVGPCLAPRVAVFHSGSEHVHDGLQNESEQRFALDDGRPRYVAILSLIHI